MNRRELESGNYKRRRFPARLEAPIFILLVVFSLLLTSCSSFPGTLYTPPVLYTIGGTVSGLTGAGLVLRDNGGNDLAVLAGATSFTFTQTIGSGQSFDVKVFSQPSNPTQTCVVTNGTGVVSSANITSVQVTCTTNAYTIGGTISGLTGTGLVLRNNGGNDLAVLASATSFTFTQTIGSGASFDVKVFSQPSNPTQTCVVTNGTGVVSSANITSVQITCTGGESGVFAYVTNQGNGSSGGSLSGYSLSSDGTLVPLAGSPFITGPHPHHLAADPQGKYLYVADENSFGIYTYAINALTGALTQVGAPTIVASAPAAIAIHPSGAWLYAPSINANTINGFSIDPVTGALTALPGSPFPDTGARPAAITLDPSGQYAFVSNNASSTISVFSINPATGQLSPKGTPISAGRSPVESRTDLPGAHLYVEDDLDNVFYTYNIADDGTLSHFSPPTFPAPFSPSYPALSPNGSFLYAPSFSPQSGGATSTVGVYSIDPATGALAEISGSPFVTGIDAGSIAIDPSGNFGYVPNGGVNSITGYSLNSATGAMSALPMTFPGGQLPSIMIFVKPNQSCGGASCATNFYKISGTISGLTGTGLVLQDNGGNALPVSAGATSFTFSTPIASGGKYNVTASSQPSNPTQTCLVTNATGLVTTGNISNVVVTCTSTFVYVTNERDSTISAYRVATDGSLTALPTSPISTDYVPEGLAADPSGKFLYVANVGSSNVSGYSIASDGSLSPIPGSPFPAASGAVSVTIDPAGKFLYLPSCGADCSGSGPGAIAAFTISPENGALTPISGSPFTAGTFPYEMALFPPAGLSSSGPFAYVANHGSNNISGYQIQSSGALSAVPGSPFAAGTFPLALAVDADPTFPRVFAVNTGSNNLSIYNIQINGSLLSISGSPIATGAFTDSVVEDANQHLYVAGGGGVFAFTANTALPSPIAGSPFVAGTGPSQVRIDPSGRFLYVVNAASNSVSGYSVNSTNGLLSALPGSPFPAGNFPHYITFASR